MEFDAETARQAAGLISPAISALNAIKGIKGSGVMSARFDPHGKWLDGNKRIAIERRASDVENIWFFSVKPRKGYTFTRVPLVASGVYEVLGFVAGSPNADARVWRWATAPPPGRIYDGRSFDTNALVEFIVVGYKADALLKHFSRRG